MHANNNNAALRNLAALVDFSNLINSNLDPNFISNNLIFTCLSKFHTSRAALAFSDGQNVLRISSYKGITDQTAKNFPEVLIGDCQSSNVLKNYLEENKFSFGKLIETPRKKIGVLFLGKKLTGRDYDEDDKSFLNTLLHIASSAMENSLMVTELKEVNRNLDAKVNQLSSLFDLSKEFSGILEKERVGKLLLYSIIGQLIVTKFAVVICEDEGFEILETRIPPEILKTALSGCSVKNFTEPKTKKNIEQKFISISKIGIELVIPMQIKGATKGLILLGGRTNNQPYNQSDIEYVSSLGSLAIISIENGRLFKETLEKQRLEKDLEIAQKIQSNLLPDKAPYMKNFDIAAINQSARQVGGDYYDLVKLDEDRLLFAVADVSGKGVQAALLMANLQAFLQSICKQNIELDQASNLINDLVSENTTDGSFITFFWGIISDKTKELIYVNMGHNPPLFIRDKKIIKLKEGGMILGVMPTIIPYKSEKIKLNTGDKIILFTDGITEAMNTQGVEYSDERLEELVINLSASSAEETLNIILNDVKVFSKGAPQSDDITSMIIKVG